jgi:hypothetical protein
MDQTSGKASSTASQNEICQLAGDLFRGAATTGRKQLDQSELSRLLAALGLTLIASGKANHTAIDLRISLNRTREFGMVLSAGHGRHRCRTRRGQFPSSDRASVYAAAELTDADDFLALFQAAPSPGSALQSRAASRTGGVSTRRRADALSSPGMLALRAGAAAGQSAESTVVPECLELNPVTVGTGIRLTVAVPPAASSRPPAPGRLPRPTARRSTKLIHPKSIGIIGVSSTSMNFGRIILKNLMGSGYPKERMCIIRPGETEIDGVRCVEGPEGAGWASSTS